MYQNVCLYELRQFRVRHINGIANQPGCIKLQSGTKKGGKWSKNEVNAEQGKLSFGTAGPTTTKN
jgi:hypothetical protein